MPGMVAPAHTHAGPEAWYTQAGETCLEPPSGKQIGRAGGPPVIVPGGPPMHRCTLRPLERSSAALWFLFFTIHQSMRPHHTLSPLAGIDLLTGKVHALVRDRHRSREFIEFLKRLDATYPAGTGDQADPR
jgi:hypothetical protein